MQVHQSFQDVFLSLPKKESKAPLTGCEKCAALQHKSNQCTLANRKEKKNDCCWFPKKKRRDYSKVIVNYTVPDAQH